MLSAKRQSSPGVCPSGKPIPDEANAEEYHNFMGKLYYNNEQYDRALEHLDLWKEYLEKREAPGKERIRKRKNDQK